MKYRKSHFEECFYPEHNNSHTEAYRSRWARCELPYPCAPSLLPSFIFILSLSRGSSTPRYRPTPSKFHELG